MTNRPENPPAFPLFVPPSVHYEGKTEQGMSLRDYFAAHAPITLEDARAVHEFQIGVTREQVFSTWTQMRYSYADAMLAARAA